MDTRLLARLGTLRQLEIFMMVAETRSIARAAEALHLSHSAVSVQIRKLAEAAGLPLHEVIGKQLYLTEAGREVVETGHELFAVIRRLDDKLNDIKGLTAGTLRISVITTAKYFLPRILGPFCRDYPDIDVAFMVGNRAQIIERLNKNLDDLYIFSDPPAEPEIECTPFLPNPLVVIASKQNPLSRRKRLCWADLAEQKFLMREQGSGTHTAVQKHLDKLGIKLGKTMVIESNEAIKYAVMENMGITILSAYALANAAEDGLVQLRVEGFPILSHWYVVHLKSKQQSLIAERFLDFILNRSRDVLPMAHIEQQVRRALAQG
ncbi:LysR family transcriptional regulator [Exilibacterium tricleocarpae]|uniref:LysR family transcriptional regulator n=1 Tax=Exilibacterium tricleocarpae TaxID=2591008 RepID=A0A545SZZ5_9GAMM|nr:LysR family transcriptional regulator [Exilibacterium tricleocarpae]TQV70544.1 LysR family transcriptional regulator [Exilibacterium tricleocarpae]